MIPDECRRCRAASSGFRLRCVGHDLPFPAREGACGGLSRRRRSGARPKCLARRDRHHNPAFRLKALGRRRHKLTQGPTLRPLDLGALTHQGVLGIIHLWLSVQDTRASASPSDGAITGRGGSDGAATTARRGGLGRKALTRLTYSVHAAPKMAATWDSSRRASLA